MNWLTELAAVYENTIRNVSDRPQLIYHISNNASLTIVLDNKGAFIKAELIGKKDATRSTNMPCTESSSSRTSGINAYPLCEKLEYIATNSEKRGLYLALINSWAYSSFGTDSLKAVAEYVKADTILSDLRKSKINTEEVTDFVRWQIDTVRLWENLEIQQSWISYYDSDEYKSFCISAYAKKDLMRFLRKEGIDCITGEYSKIAGYHPAKIRNSGDMAKIISSNDEKNYTFRGLFENADEACAISSVITQKAHSALRWLISKQGYKIIIKKDERFINKSHFGNGLTVVTWNRSGVSPSILEDSEHFGEGFDFGFDVEEETVYDSGKAFAEAMCKRLRGYYVNQKSINEYTMVMVIKEATPDKGRAAVAMYRELRNADMLDSLERWYNALSWFKKYKDQKSEKWRYSIGTPSPKMIAECAYGSNVKPEIVEKTIQRIIPCILDGTIIPVDIETQCIKSASNLLTVEEWNRDIILGTACAVYKFNRLIRDKEEFKVALEEDRKDRDYLFGRLLAISHAMEKTALRRMGAERETNAIRYMQRFSIRPMSTWTMLYKDKLPAYRRHIEPRLMEWYEGKIRNISGLFNVEEYSDKALTGEFLLGYQCQLKDLYTKSVDTAEITMEE